MVESPYNCMLIHESRDRGRPVRILSTDPDYSQSGMYLDDPDELYFDYTRFYALAVLARPQARDILMLGGGGGSVPKWLLSGKSGLDAADLRLTVVELDPGMSAVAGAGSSCRGRPASAPDPCRCPDLPQPAAGTV